MQYLHAAKAQGAIQIYIWKVSFLWQSLWNYQTKYYTYLIHRWIILLEQDQSLSSSRNLNAQKYASSADIFKAIWLQNLGDFILVLVFFFNFKHFSSINGKVRVEGYQKHFFSIFKVLVKYFR